MGELVHKTEAKRNVTPPVQQVGADAKSRFKDARPETAAISQMQQGANQSPQVQQLAQMKQAANGSPQAKLEASPIQAKKGDKPDFTPAHTDDEFAKKQQKSQISASLTEAFKMINRAKANVGKDNKVFKTWMDAGKVDNANVDKRVAHVKDGVDKIETVLEKETVHMKEYALNDGEEKSTYAYVDPSEADHNIYLGGAFWGAKTKGYNSKAGTIIHELSHRVHGTDDHEYGKTDAKRLAKEDPELAVTNADNYEYLAESSK
jgi:Lysine-specific metallo-endopeptidase